MISPRKYGYEIGRLVAFLQPVDPTRRPEMHGTIIASTGSFAEEVELRGDAIEDHEMPTCRFSGGGLLYFEGFVEASEGPDPDIYLSGTWRPLTHSELLDFACGRMPWRDAQEDA